MKPWTDAGEGERDPVCGMRVDPLHPRGGTHRHPGKTYGFCGPRCLERFAADPERYLAPRAPVQAAPSGAGARQATEGHPAPPAAATATWTCPMHPEVESDRPGACPKCGM